MSCLSGRLGDAVRRVFGGWYALVFLLLVVASTATQAGMEALSDSEMGEVRAQDGIAFEWDIRVNANADGSPDESLENWERRIAVSLAEREGEWLVLKDVSGRINFPTFTLDAARSPSTATPFEDSGRFVDGQGSLVTPYGRPNLLVRFPESIEFYDVEIGGMAVEEGSVPEEVDPGAPPETGFFADQADESSFLGLRISNSIPDQPARLSAEGNMTVFGF